MRRGLALALSFSCWAAFLPATPPLAADTYPRQPGVDALHYVFRLTLRDDRDEIAGETTARLRFVAAGVAEVAFDLASARDGKGMTVASVTSGGRALAFRHAADRLTVTLPAPSVAGSEVEITVLYSGVPASGLHIGPNKFGERTYFSRNWPDRARQWLPAIDHPSDKATGELVVTAPAHYQAVSNGLLVEETDLPEGLRRTLWRQSVPISSWLFNLGVARFASHHAGQVAGVEIQTWVFPQERDRGVEVFEETARAALAFYSERIGPFPYEKLANVQAVGVNGGMEHASAIFYGEDLVTREKPIAGIVAHEIAHQWFGDSVTEADWDDVWLSEGFATYFAALFTEHSRGRDAFVEELKGSRAKVFEAEVKSPSSPIVHRNLADMGKVLNGLVYQKGAWTLHMLRRKIGDEAFWSGIREYYRLYRNRNATTADFRQVMEAASGQELGPFFAQWLNRSGVPRLGGSWRYDEAKREVEVTLRQGQPGEPYRLPIAIALRVAASPAGTKESAPERIERVDLTAPSATFRFPSETAPAEVVLDPGTDLLFEADPFTRLTGTPSSPGSAPG